MNDSKLKTINIIGNIFLLLNLIVGLLQVHWAIIFVFAIIHAIIRLQYIKAEQQIQLASGDTTQTTIAPPMVRNFASVITATIMAGILYGVGYGIRYGFTMLAG